MTRLISIGLRLYRLAAYRTLDMFDCVSLETDSRCNRKCSYCPVSLHLDAPRAIMSEDTLHRLLRELRAMRYLGAIDWGIFNEPTMDERLPRFVADARQLLPRCPQTIHTNGDYLDMPMAANLLDAGATRFIVSRHDNIPLTGHLTTLARMCPGKISFNFICADDALSRRGDCVPARLGRRPARCEITNLLIRANGAISLCCHDYDAAAGIGNVNDAPIRSLWNNAGFSAIRRSLAAGEGADYEPCRRCRVGFGRRITGREWLKGKAA